tara:strand:- start:626 stop:853 length:228 start_codon:yes stop_codon:yes gene_type:complete
MLGQRLKQVRKFKLIIQVQRAKLPKVSETRISVLETSQTRQSIRTMKIAPALGVRPAWLETGVEQNDNVDSTLEE